MKPMDPNLVKTVNGATVGTTATNGMNTAGYYAGGYGTVNGATVGTTATNGMNTAGSYANGYGTVNGTTVGTTATNGMNTAGSYASGYGTVNVMSTSAKVGLSMGAKIGIAIASFAVIVAAILVFVKLKDKNKEDIKESVSTEISSSVTTTEVDVTEEKGENVVVDEQTLRYKAYYDIVCEKMETTKTEITISLDIFTRVVGFWNANLVDLNNDGADELIIAYSDKENYAGSGSCQIIELYEYDGSSAVLADSITVDNSDNRLYLFSYFLEDSADAGVLLGICEEEIVQTSGYCDYITKYAYIDGKLVEINKIIIGGTKKDVSYIDGAQVSNEEASNVKRAFDKDLNIDFYFPEYIGGDQAINQYVSKALLVKHRTIAKLASACGDTEFNAIADAFICKEFSDTELDMSNKYNEDFCICDRSRIYMDNLSGEGTYRLSEDRKTLYFEKHNSIHYKNEIPDDTEMYCYQYKEGVIICVGGVEECHYTGDDGNTNNETYFFFDADADSYIVKNPTAESHIAYKVNYEEFITRKDQLLNN